MKHFHKDLMVKYSEKASYEKEIHTYILRQTARLPILDTANSRCKHCQSRYL